MPKPRGSRFPRGRDPRSGIGKSKVGKKPFGKPQPQKNLDRKPWVVSEGNHYKVGLVEFGEKVFIPVHEYHVPVRHVLEKKKVWIIERFPTHGKRSTYIFGLLLHALSTVARSNGVYSFQYTMEVENKWLDQVLRAKGFHAQGGHSGSGEERHTVYTVHLNDKKK